MIISFLNEKGGVGKTTLSTNIAKGLQDLNYKVLLVDSDPQGSARDWHANGNGDLLQMIGLDRPTIDKDILAFKSQFDFIIIDGAPQLTTMAVKAILCSDLVLIPVQPSPFDIWASTTLVDFIKQRQEINNGNPRAAFVINRQIVGTNLGKEVRKVLEEYGFPVFKNGTCQRISYAEMAASGRCVLDSTDKTASNEIKLILDELQAFIKGEPNERA